MKRIQNQGTIALTKKITLSKSVVLVRKFKKFNFLLVLLTKISIEMSLSSIAISKLFDIFKPIYIENSIENKLKES